ncbi:hypothetical protein C8Q75DRAFT_456150 [Abortiporus biennis]|nr:hypothetical protein C8Q75DRAFT_456150 [Abortiporus biennis]
MDSKPREYYVNKGSTAANQLIGVFGSLNKQYIEPGSHLWVKSFETRPITTTFLTTWVALGIFPIVTFVYECGSKWNFIAFADLFLSGVSFFTSLTLIFFAICGAIIASSFAILLFGTCLAITLATLFGVSCFVTSALIPGFLLFRLAFCAFILGTREGFAVWSKETLDRFYYGKPLNHHRGHSVGVTQPPKDVDKKASLAQENIKSQDQDSDFINMEEEEKTPSAKTEEGHVPELFKSSQSGLLHEDLDIHSSSSDTSDSSADSTAIMEDLNPSMNRYVAMQSDDGLKEPDKPIFMGESPIFVKKDLDYERLNSSGGVAV